MIQLAPRGDEDLVLVAALTHVEHGVADQLVADADAAGAHDAALAVIDDGRAEAHTLDLVDGFGVFALQTRAVLEPVVLELALAGLVADRAVDGVVQEQELLHRSLRLLHVLVLRRDLHAVRRAHLTGGLKLRLGVRNVLVLLVVPLEDGHVHPPAAGDFHQAHPTVGRHRQPRVPAVVRDLDPGAPGGAHDAVPGFDRDFLVIDLDRSHQRSHSPPIMLTEPKVGMMSASMSPITICRAPCRLNQQGGRTRTRYGVPLPSETMKKPSSRYRLRCNCRPHPWAA